MHVSILAGLLLASSAYNEHEARVAEPFHQLVRVGAASAALLRKTKPRSICQRFELFTWDLQRGMGLTCLHSRLMQQSAWHAMPSRGARLRARFAPIFGKANRFTLK